MNAARRKQLNDLSGKVSDLVADLEAIRDEEQDAFEAMPESLQQSERGQASEQAVHDLESAISSLESAQSEIDQSTSN